ncbi:hypothetical protein SELMODRAFT_444121 [Selaginella moellendorffii]|uniref:PHD-type domain-containing protein n=2 Tax=Selaginella moellendorffii TaxID=88036 RepID=D8S732_SELML|nr:hypothetical protein SELMODRAFT_444121 [Selaginella moellendorffii]
MAFHVACPLTCRKICNCALGSSGPLRKLGGKDAFLRNAAALQKLLAKSPLMITTGEDTVEVLVPRQSKESSKKKKKKPSTSVAAAAAEEDGGAPQDPQELQAQEEEKILESVPEPEADHEPEQEEEPEQPEQPEPEPEMEEQSVPAEDNQPDYQTPDDGGGEVSTPSQPEESVAPPEEIFCGLCQQAEAESKKQERMLTCQGCDRRFHRKCLKDWAGNRDLFNWASWRCLHCRTCEDCKVTGDPNRLLFCKRCDEAHHNNCKQSGAKAPAKGPFLCPKHSQCHSCGTRVPGGGSSSRWFHSYLFCDACGRLFVKDKYCPICMKVYRESEPTPMVLCDGCEHWVHCVCEGISDEKYQEFQTIQNLRFTCAACRGECFQATSVEEAVVELWKRKDEADRDQIKSLRASAGLPSESEMARLCPSSDDEQAPASAPARKEGKWVFKVNSSSKTRGKSSEEAADSSKKRSRSDNVEPPETERKTLKLKIKKPSGTEVVEASNTARGQRSKRKRPASSQEEEVADAVESDEDDTSILHRLGSDAVTKRVEVCRSSDKTWLKGTITHVQQRRSQFTVNFDNGDKKTLKYGKEKVRLLGKRERGAYPTMKNFRFLKRLHLKTIVSLTPEAQPNKDLRSFCQDQGIHLQHFHVDKFQDVVTLSHNQVVEILHKIISVENLPAYLHCLDGAHVTGLVVMCLRKLQCWNLSTSTAEFCRFQRTGEISREESQFVESFQGSILIPPRIPQWLWQGVRTVNHPIFRLTYLPDEESDA